MRCTFTRLATLAALAAPPIVPAALAAQGGSRYTLSGSAVAIYDLAGKVRLEAGSGSDVVVSVDRVGADADKLRVLTGPIGGSTTLRVLFPARRISYPGMRDNSSTTLRVNEDGTFGDEDDGGDRVTITGSGGGLEAGADLRIAVPRGKRVVLHLAVGDAAVANVDGDLTVNVNSADITVNGARGRLRLDGGSGNVRVSDVQAELDVDTGSGSVTVTGAKSDRVRLDTGSGGARVSNVEASRLEIDVGSGSIDASAVRVPDVKLDAGSGSVDVALAGEIRNLDIDAGSGNVTVHVPASVGAELSVETGSGGIRTDLPVQATKLERDALVGKIGDGRGRIHIETGSGGVRLLTQQ
ncbi:MAG TPA: DUF4097 family beta strand repeat-containing protein [Gemmatimonadaceae bacterium]|nr:DUF4097 family beta strand repeat-containing protein [Gemmatimonadaceae bacterium]